MASESEKQTTKATLLERLSNFLLREPEDREQLLELLHGAYENHLMDADSLAMIEGVLQVSEMQVRDIMIPRSQMDVIDITDAPETFIPHVIETAHSRFPVIEDDKNDVIGILLAKDLLRYYAGEDFEVRDMLRPAVFIPEAKRLNVLLKEFRSNRNHIAIVVDEYGACQGVITLEDILEEIVGDIVDEHDVAVASSVKKIDEHTYRVKGTVTIRDINRLLDWKLPDDEAATVAGLVMHETRHIPEKGATFILHGYRFTVEDKRANQILQLIVEKQTHENI